MNVHLQYGHTGIDVEIPGRNVTVLRPQFIEGMEDEKAAFHEAVRHPIGAAPLADLVDAGDRVAIVIADLTRPLPSDRLLTWIFEELSHVPAENFTVIIGTGTHRANTADEIRSMVGDEVLRRVRVINHNAYDNETMHEVRPAGEGRPALMFNRDYVEADKRILVGFIEPHFMAGFSGGYKAVFPGIANLAAIMHYHRADAIGHPRSTWGILEENPTQAQIRQNGSTVPVTFLVNVTLNHRRQITGYYCGDVITAHEAGCRVVKETAMVACPQRYPLIVTTNSGYPLDQNLYQTVKGMCAAAEIIEDGGLMVVAARCNDGFPAHGNFARLLYQHDSAQAMLDTIYAPGFHMLDQWQVQKFAQVLLKSRVALYSELSAAEVAQAHIDPIADLNAYLRDLLAQLGPEIPIAVLPEGPMTIPYVAEMVGV
jgi:lactate racemase